MGVLVLLVLIVAIVVLFKKHGRTKEAKRNMALNNQALAEKDGFVPDLIEHVGSRWALGIDAQNNRVAFAVAGATKFLNFEQIVSVEPLLNGKAIQSDGSNRQLVGLVAGDILGGGVGAMAGLAMSKTIYKSLILRILTEDLVQPWIEVEFMPTGKERFAKQAEAEIQQWQAWLGRFQVIVSRNAQTVQASRPVREMVG